MTPAQRNQDARKLLAYFYAAYEQTGGRNFVISPQDPDTLSDVGMTDQDYTAAMNRLRDKNLLESMTLGGGCSLAQFGIDASEDESLLDSLLPVAKAPAARPAIEDDQRSDMTNEKADPRKVFIIHGRNVEARKQMGIFLRALGLEPLNFDDLRASLKGTPTIADIVIEGMKLAQGVVALFTPDEHATLRPELSGKNDSGEMVERWQARPNVLFEAGMAFGKDRDRVVLVRLGRVSLFTDVGGVHILSPTNDARGDRNTLRMTLKHMGCAVNLEASDWLHDGDFDSCVLPEVSTQSPFRD